MQASTRVILIRNESLTLTCNTTNVNGEIKLKWVKPLGSVRLLSFYTVLCSTREQIFRPLSHVLKATN